MASPIQLRAIVTASFPTARQLKRNAEQKRFEENKRDETLQDLAYMYAAAWMNSFIEFLFFKNLEESAGKAAVKGRPAKFREDDIAPAAGTMPVSLGVVEVLKEKLASLGETYLNAVKIHVVQLMKNAVNQYNALAQAGLLGPGPNAGAAPGAGAVAGVPAGAAGFQQLNQMFYGQAPNRGQGGQPAVVGGFPATPFGQAMLLQRPAEEAFENKVDREDFQAFSGRVRQEVREGFGSQLSEGNRITARQIIEVAQDRVAQHPIMASHASANMWIASEDDVCWQAIAPTLLMIYQCQRAAHGNYVTTGFGRPQEGSYFTDDQRSQFFGIVMTGLTPSLEAVYHIQERTHQYETDAAPYAKQFRAGGLNAVVMRQELPRSPLMKRAADPSETARRPWQPF